MIKSSYHFPRNKFLANYKIIFLCGITCLSSICYLFQSEKHFFFLNVLCSFLRRGSFMSYFTYCLFYTIYQYLSFIILWCCANSGVSAGRILCSNIVAVESSKKWREYIDTNLPHFCTLKFGIELG